MVAIAVGFWLGCAALAAQLVLLREFLALAGGSEVAIGLTLAAWLAAGGAGSLAAAAVRRPGWPAAAASLCALGGATLSGLWLIWHGREFLGASPGELVGWLKALAYAFAAAGPAAFLGGAAFAFASNAARDATRVYVAEAAGACVAALALSTALYRWLAPPATCALVLFAGAAAGAFAAAGSRRWARGAAAGLAAAAAVAGGGVLWRNEAIMADWFFAGSFPGEKVLAYRVSPYGAIAATARRDQFNLYENGLLVASLPDALAAEETVHPTMLLRPEAERVILFGGGLTGALEEFRKYPRVRRVTYVELDGELVNAAREGFGVDVVSSPAVAFVAEDGRFFARRAASAGVRADVVIVHMPLPASAQVNRFFTREFFEDCHRLLKPGGLLAFTAPGAANYYSPELSVFLSSAYATAAAVFRNVAALPGEQVTFLASDGELAPSARLYGERLQALGIRNDYLTPRYFYFALTPDRRAAVARATAAAAPANTDFKPAALYFGLRLWAGRLSGAEVAILAAAGRLRLWYIIAFAGALAAPWLLWRRRLAGRAAVALAVAVQGFVEIALEVIIILGFQAIYGAAYLELALIIGAFMAGVAVGGLLPGRRAAAGRQTLINVLGYAALLALALPPVFYGLARWPTAPTAVVHAVFAAAAFAAGLCGGAQFVVALRAWRGRGAAVLYGLDLAGSAVGAVAVAVAFVPVFGLARTALAAAALAAAPMVALAAGRGADNGS